MVSSGPKATVIQGLLDGLHERCLKLVEGAPADYIPELAKADPSDFGIAIATVDGRLYTVGDTDKLFTIQSISKPFVYGLALDLLGTERMKAKVGVEPSGEAFNAISLDPASGRPRNPMINAGAIATTAQISCHDPENAEEILLDYFAELAGRRLTIDEQVYQSERHTGHRNRAISHLLRNFDIIESDPEQALDLYFRQCSILVSCRDLAVMAATLACQGGNPFTGAQPLTSQTTTRLLALMATCGTYDFAGQWLYDVGMPAKSGVAGGVLAVVPGRLGIATYSPPLDPLGNSVRGIAVCNELSKELGLSLFNQYPENITTIRRSYKGSQRHSRRFRPPAQLQCLQQSRDSLRIVHAQGVLDFAAVERLIAELAQLLVDAWILVIDFANVSELPEESRHLLVQELASLRCEGVMVLLVRCHHLGLEAEPVIGTDARPMTFLHLDQAIERAEDLLLDSMQPEKQGDNGAEPRNYGGFLELLDPIHHQTLFSISQLRVFSAGDHVITKGEPGDELFIVKSGRFTVTTQLQGKNGVLHESRLATFEPGMCFGEIAFLSKQKRSADVIADVAGSCWVLARAVFDQLREREPGTVTDMLLALTGDLGTKLGVTSFQLMLMEYL
ncbi:glutaminase A [Synechococcus sp. Tobar12-5m-g]|uniref:glutaminase A n=1 Tax=unclassified Synechococcus TaxID=2626047 RepID=UPI0020CF33BD|nr:MULTISPECIES: glutaminase A [unclassified Synechococcus]MCP9772872.1 glutaminase A [Synechococcus sp. Tobar12-5m-g]MCP9873662.1 glutaminase A [Synechococcus sp. Cruz CV-v-12]